MAGGALKKKKASPNAKNPHNDFEKPPNLLTSVEEFTGKKASPKSGDGTKKNARGTLRELPLKKRPRVGSKEAPKKNKAANKSGAVSKKASPKSKASTTKRASPKAKKGADASVTKKTSPKSKKDADAGATRKASPKAKKDTDACVTKKAPPKAKKDADASVTNKASPKAKQIKIDPPKAKQGGVAKGRVKRRRTSDTTGKKIKKKKKSKKEKEAEEAAEKEIYREGFSRLDTDKDGLLSFTEFAEAMAAVGNPTLSHRNLVLLFNKAAKESKIGLPDFLALRGYRPRADKERKRRDRAARRSL